MSQRSGSIHIGNDALLQRTSFGIHPRRVGSSRVGIRTRKYTPRACLRLLEASFHLRRSRAVPGAHKPIFSPLQNDNSTREQDGGLQWLTSTLLRPYKISWSADS